MLIEPIFDDNIFLLWLLAYIDSVTDGAFRTTLVN